MRPHRRGSVQEPLRSAELSRLFAPYRTLLPSGCARYSSSSPRRGRSARCSPRLRIGGPQGAPDDVPCKAGRHRPQVGGGRCERHAIDPTIAMRRRVHAAERTEARGGDPGEGFDRAILCRHPSWPGRYAGVRIAQPFAWQRSGQDCAIGVLAPLPHAQHRDVNQRVVIRVDYG